MDKLISFLNKSSLGFENLDSPEKIISFLNNPIAISMIDKIMNKLSDPDYQKKIMNIIDQYQPDSDPKKILTELAMNSDIFDTLPILNSQSGGDIGALWDLKDKLTEIATNKSSDLVWKNYKNHIYLGIVIIIIIIALLVANLYVSLSQKGGIKKYVFKTKKYL